MPATRSSVRFTMGSVERLAIGALILILGACSAGDNPSTEQQRSQAERPATDQAPGSDHQIQTAPATAQQRRNNRALKKCFEDKGWTADMDERTGVVGYGGSVEQAGSQQKAWEDCEKDLLKAGTIQPERKLSDTELATLYDKIIEQTRCFEAHGYEPSQKPPSRRAFIDEGGIWTPHALIRYIEGEELKQLDNDCPEPRQ